MIIIANWKLNLTLAEIKSWVLEFNAFSSSYSLNKVTPVICPSFIYVSYLKENLLNAHIGTQDSSEFLEGEYTGEVSAKQLKDYISYSIIGHSERRKNFSETDDIVQKKARLCVEHQITPVICVSALEQAATLKSFRDIIIALEPLENIGSGIPAKPEFIEDTAKKIVDIIPSAKVLYGGSVTAENAKGFSKLKNISGFLVGGESLNPVYFINIIKKCDM
ncbi:hypothetical protein COT69_01990 [candidate division WWE3 bacterium CG09_land_8_20_14_0_10_39_24]|uniref:Triosephosphate isomerase n=1 Tax=candidate division WWE3 bacterium CG09_land_8_20_14_0_10_39_24 TaxID=1975088 RepID=A0A2H0WJU4_UNCKA|nr:MAG: hypothetical protein AUJ94_01295 [bacterium CG2_30_40_12]OJI08808.1 MAG: hypothetical protein BK003_01965 [bacterium CG09_39_24]PIS12835.1 MAG: hypothetical protein COT69_01990 [candidate division WWE3 bacterium CG09_land_8_20_14_0_10_39_24]